jgi:hypothetical protein
MKKNKIMYTCITSRIRKAAKETRVSVKLASGLKKAEQLRKNLFMHVHNSVGILFGRWVITKKF